VGFITAITAFAIACVYNARSPLAPPESRDPAFLQIAGEYLARTGTDGELAILLEADGGFRYTRTGKVERQYAGRWRLDAGAVELLPTYDEANERFPDMQVHWRPIRWGDRLYLPPDGKIIQLVNAINHGDEPRTSAKGVVPLRRDDWNREVIGDPELPETWRNYLLRSPLEGRIVEFEEGGFARLDKGGDDGLLGGMVLLAHLEGTARCCELKIICPCEDRARADVVCPEDCAGPDAPFGDLILSDQFSTTRAVLKWEKVIAPNTPARVAPGADTPGGPVPQLRILFVPEARPMPLDLAPLSKEQSAASSGDTCAESPVEVRAAFGREWAEWGPRIVGETTTEDLSRLALRLRGTLRGVSLPPRWDLQLVLEPLARERRTGGILFGHQAHAGIPLPKARGWNRRLCVSALFDPVTSRISTVFITVQGWIEE